jgi:hypothetical protein
MKTITLKFVIPDEDEKMAEDIVQIALADKLNGLLMCNWTVNKSTKMEERFYKKQRYE